MTIVTRSGKGSELTHNELDGNFTDLDTRTKSGWRDNIVSIYSDPSDVSSPTLEYFNGGIKKYMFSSGEITQAYADWHIDHDYKLNTKLYLHVHWSTLSTDIGTVRWGFEYSVAKGHQQAVFPNPTTVYVEQTTTGQSKMHYVAEVSEANAIPGTGIEPDTLITVRLFRDGSHPNDTLNANVFGLCLDLHYECDRYATPNKVPNFYA